MNNLIENDLTTEVYREYDFGGRVYKIENPVKLFTRIGGTTHRVVDTEGVVHCLPAPGFNGCVLRWKNKDTNVPVNSNDILKHEIRCLENTVEHFENIPSEYKYVWDKEWDDMNEAEKNAYYKAIPAAKLTPCDNVTGEIYDSDAPSMDCDDSPIFSMLLTPEIDNEEIPEGYVFDTSVFDKISCGIIYEALSPEEIKLAKRGLRRKREDES